MLSQILATKLHQPLLPPNTVFRPRLIEQLDKASHCRLILISAAAGFGKTTLISEWIKCSSKTAAWLSLDSDHSDPSVFLTYLIASVQSVSPDIGKGLISAVQSPETPPSEYIITNLINEISETSISFILVLDDYHILDSAEIDNIITFLIKNIPPNLRIVISTREDPQLPIAGLRGKGELFELRIKDLRFTKGEISVFLNKQMDLDLSENNLSALETRTEGWITGLQLAAISMQGNKDTAGFINSFTGSHRFILDYLIEEVLNQQPEYLQSFLLRTSILERMSAPLCDAVLKDPSKPSVEILKNLETSNMFIIALDNERKWYRYHHLFADLLKHSLMNSSDLLLNEADINELHSRAGKWYEDNGYYIEAFQHTALAEDIDSIINLIERNGIYWNSRSTVVPILNWLKSLPENILNSRPILWITYANVLLCTGQTKDVEKILNSAEVLIPEPDKDLLTRDLTGRIAVLRAISAVTRYDYEYTKSQSLRALEYLSEDNQGIRAISTWTLAESYEIGGDYNTAKKYYHETLKKAEASKNYIFTLLAKIKLASIESEEIHITSAAEKLLNIIKTIGDQPLPVLGDVYLELAKIYYQRNDTENALEYIQKNIELAKIFENTIDRFIISEVFKSRIKLFMGDADEAYSLISETSNTVKQFNFIHRVNETAEMQVLVLLKKNKIQEAKIIADKYDLSLSKVRINLAEGNSASALSIIEPLFSRFSESQWSMTKLKLSALYAVVLYKNNEIEKALNLAEQILSLCEPENIIRIFIDEGLPMFELISDLYKKGIKQDYISRLLSAFNDENISGKTRLSSSPDLIEQLSQREVEVLNLIAEGYSNKDICDKLFIALDTVKGHNRRIFGKLGVENRAHAVNRARKLKIIN